MNIKYLKNIILSYNMLFTKPSYYALIFTGGLILLSFIHLFKHFSRIKNLTPEIQIKLFSSVGILIGVHGLLHLGLETIYNYNPLENKY